MYSGTTFRRGSGRIVGAHQKIDRVARRHLEKRLQNTSDFPGIKSILHFEGKNGPDGIKLKSPLQDEFEHVIDPTDPSDDMLVTIIGNHIHNLTTALKDGNEVRAAFEAAWLSHAVADGMTPPHHYKLEDAARENWIKMNDQMLSRENQEMVDEATRRSGFKEKWGSWGSGGVVAHVLFELGVASVMTPGSFKNAAPSDEDIARLKREGFEKIFVESVRDIYDMGLYDTFCKKGWTRGLAKKTRDKLIPTTIKMVTLAWYQAVLSAFKADL